MSKNQPSKKKVVVTTTPSATSSAAATTSKRKPVENNPTQALEFGKQNYILMLAGAGLIALGLLLMSGGAMPSPDVWDNSIIYSTRRTFIAPLVMIIGLVVEIYAIFKRF
ncbi:MAG TPA: DUF3098 domain-containing protein [Saprospiraceae bacterium]|nr:DUF3098 domain-containing protein [Saprospiraceae bacterium]HMQ84256.1 DUF3098 domain-containing protein [Saprospiraceae bacterium]